MDMRGIASIALLPSGSISGHFVDLLTSKCFGLFGTQISCERECSRGDDYRLINLSILDYTTRKEVQVIVECRGHDAARFRNATDVHGWEEEVMQDLESKANNGCVPNVKFECEVLKADEDAEEHIRRYLPALSGREAVVNVGPMEIEGLNFETTEGVHETHCHSEEVEIEAKHVNLSFEQEAEGIDNDKKETSDGLSR